MEHNALKYSVCDGMNQEIREVQEGSQKSGSSYKLVLRDGALWEAHVGLSWSSWFAASRIRCSNLGCDTRRYIVGPCVALLTASYGLNRF